jgi:hypothetical protein
MEEATYAILPAKDAREALRWRRLRARVASAFRPRSDPSVELDKHRKKLIELGYFQERNFALQSSNLARLVYPAVVAAGMSDSNWCYSSTGGTNVSVTAATFDMPKWEQVFSNLNNRAQGAAP